MIVLGKWELGDSIRVKIETINVNGSYQNADEITLTVTDWNDNKIFTTIPQLQDTGIYYADIHFDSSSYKEGSYVISVDGYQSLGGKKFYFYEERFLSLTSH